jgi:hypothetical protein
MLSPCSQAKSEFHATVIWPANGLHLAFVVGEQHVIEVKAVGGKIGAEPVPDRQDLGIDSVNSSREVTHNHHRRILWRKAWSISPPACKRATSALSSASRCCWTGASLSWNDISRCRCCITFLDIAAWVERSAILISRRFLRGGLRNQSFSRHHLCLMTWAPSKVSAAAWRVFMGADPQLIEPDVPG